jgi:uncharacterized SAM-dependent methyltransferase
MGRYAHSYPQYINDPAGGASFWEKFIRSPEYYIFGEECRLIQAEADQIISCLPDNISLIELGPGESQAVRNKTVPVIEAFNKSANSNKDKNIAEYIALDISSDYVKNARRIIEGKFSIPTSGVSSDFTTENLKINTKETPVMLMFGGTLFNVSSVVGLKTEYMLRSYLDNIRDIMGEEGYLVVTQDKNRDLKKLRKAYNHKMCETTALSIMHRIERDLDTQNFSGDDFKYRINWDPRKELLSLNAVSNVEEPKSFTISNIRFAINKGDEFPLVNAFKFSTKTFKTIANEAGFSVIKTIENKKDDPIALHILKMGPKPRQPF